VNIVKTGEYFSPKIHHFVPPLGAPLRDVFQNHLHKLFYTPMKRTILHAVILVMLISVSNYSQTYNAICAGINDYPGTDMDLHYSVNDASRIAYNLLTYKHWDGSKVTIITDASANKTNIRTSIENLPKTSGNTDLFSFSGHGDSHTLGAGPGDGILLSNSSGVLISPSELQTYFGSAYNQYAVYIDACRSGMFPDQMTTGVICSACTADEDCYENTAVEDGYYSYFLIQGLALSSISTAEALQNYAAPLTTQAMSEQSPQMSDHCSGSLYIVNATLSGTLPNSQVWAIPFSLQGNVQVPSGITLTLNSTVNLNGYSIVNTGGTINLNSNANLGNFAYLKSGSSVLGYFPTIQSAVNYFSGGSSSNYYTIALQPRTYSESVTFSGKPYMTLDGLGSATINSCTINNSSYINVQNLTLNSQIQLSGSSYTDISGVTVTSGGGIVSDYNGVQNRLYNSYGTNGGAAFGYMSYGGTGDVYQNHISGWDCGVYLGNSARYNVGPFNEFCGNGNDVCAYAPAYAYCISNDYTNNLADSVYHKWSVVGNYTISGNANGVCTGSKAVRKQIADGSATTESVTGGNDLVQQYLNLLQQMKTDKENGVVNTASYVETVGTIIGKLMVKFVTAFDKDSFKKNIVFLSQLYNTIGTKSDFNNALAILSGNKLFSNYLPFIKRYEIGTDIDNRDYKKAADLTNTIMANKNTDTDLLCEMLYEKGLIYKNYLNDTVTAKAAFTELAVNHSDNILSKFALAQLSQSDGGTLGKQIAPLAGTETQKAITGFGNYPNPFNPTTKICYPVEQAGAIKLSVYNLLGQRVAELVNCYMEKGNYTVDFDGSKLASGLYIYTLQAGNKFTSRKMFLLK
jgi:hypothetical protein